MSTAQSVSRGSSQAGAVSRRHQLSLGIGREYADSAKFVHDVQVKSACARERLTHPNDAKLPNGHPNYYALLGHPLATKMQQ
jgi:hypothetical protein